MFSDKKGKCEASAMCCKTDGQVAAWFEDRKVSSLSPGQNNLVNKNVITNFESFFLFF